MSENITHEQNAVLVPVEEFDELKAENTRLRDKLRRVRDWLKHAANSPGGIVFEIDEMLKVEGE